MKHNQKGFTRTNFAKQNFRGFTLVELLIVIAIIAILSAIGFVIYTKVAQAAKDAKRKGDVDAISKAYEVNYLSAGTYQPVKNADFASGIIPSLSEGGSYSGMLTTAVPSFRICAALEGNSTHTCDSPSSTCFCRESQMERFVPSVTPTPTPISTPTPTPTCDPGGTLTTGLVGYWKMDEVSWNGTAGEVIDSSGNNNLTSNGGLSTDHDAQFGRAGKFNAGGVYRFVGGQTSSAINNLPDFTYTAWVKLLDYGVDSLSNIGIIGKVNSWQFRDLGLTQLSTAPGYEREAGKLDALITTRVWNQAWNGGVGRWEPAGQDKYARSISLQILPLGSWHLVTMIYNNTGDRYIKLYLDGNEVTYDIKQAAQETITEDQYANIGASSSGNILIDDARIYSRVLTDIEINQLYNGGNGCVP